MPDFKYFESTLILNCWAKNKIAFWITATRNEFAWRNLYGIVSKLPSKQKLASKLAMHCGIRPMKMEDIKSYNLCSSESIGLTFGTHRWNWYSSKWYILRSYESLMDIIKNAQNQSKPGLVEKKFRA